MEEKASVCNFLKDPLSINDLITSGTSFEINTNFDEGFTNVIYDELNLGSDDELDDDSKNPIDQSTLVSPWTKPFEELKLHMQQLNPYMWKKVTKTGDENEPVVPITNTRACIRYNAYWEGEGAPFDSSFLRGSSYSFYTGRNEVLEGLENAVCTMHKGENAQFLISYHLLFREMGCPPRVKPKADGLFIIELVGYNLVGDIDADEQIPEEDRNKYSVVIDKVKEIHLKALDFFSQGMHRNACRAFEKALDLLKFSRLSNEEEEKEQTAFLLKLYTNLAVCYIKVNAPAKTCIMCKEIRHLTNNKPSCKALFQEGRALLMLGEYERARGHLIKAQHMEPHNADISRELKLLEERYKSYKENEQKMWTKAMGLLKNARNEPVKPSDEDLNELEQEMLKLLRNFKDDEKQKDLKLPAGLTNSEIETLDELAKRLELKLTLDTLDNTLYTIKKK
ncbi:inactive peptidyl-prolyl cis-trans isomerase shutdown-like [Haematobia irritans]|uniref:inactive peptidyl-prolyl cis-trans isomerase shutdown-like n=1 Tax=Haematobia irritans TaxID=7368 RepID=UPI003F5090EB